MLPNPNEVFLNSKQVRTRYGGVSDMAVWRWLRNDHLAFPQPISINKRRFWALSDLERWERDRAADRTAA